MVSDHLVDRIQAYVAATILLRPLNSDCNAGDARSILDDIGARPTRPDSAQADTQFPVTPFTGGCGPRPRTSRQEDELPWPNAVYTAS